MRNYAAETKITTTIAMPTQANSEEDCGKQLTIVVVVVVFQIHVHVLVEWNPDFSRNLDSTVLYFNLTPLELFLVFL